MTDYYYYWETSVTSLNKRKQIMSHPIMIQSYFDPSVFTFFLTNEIARKMRSSWNWRKQSQLVTLFAGFLQRYEGRVFTFQVSMTKVKNSELKKIIFKYLDRGSIEWTASPWDYGLYVLQSNHVGRFGLFVQIRHSPKIDVLLPRWQT